MKIAICDDQQNALEHILSKLKIICPQDEIKSFLKIFDLFQKIKDGNKFDVILMDIEWNEENSNGIDFASELLTLSPKTKIIFITGYPEQYSQQIFLKNTNLRGFIAKPIDTEILLKNLRKIKDEMILEEKRKLIIKFNGVITNVDPHDILYITSSAHTATIYTKEEKLSCYKKLNDLAKRLPEQFIVTHKSFLVNMEKIRRIEREFVILLEDMEIPISKSRYSEVREKYFRYINENMTEAHL